MKINKIILAGIMSLALAGCSNSNQQETDPMELLDAASETTTASDISETTTVSETASEETESETTTESETITTTESSTVSETSMTDSVVDEVAEDELVVVEQSELDEIFEDGVTALGGTVLKKFERSGSQYDNVMGFVELEDKYVFCHVGSVKKVFETDCPIKKDEFVGNFEDYDVFMLDVEPATTADEFGYFKYPSVMVLASRTTGLTYISSLWGYMDGEEPIERNFPASDAGKRVNGVYVSMVYYKDGQLGVYESKKTYKDLPMNYAVNLDGLDETKLLEEGWDTNADDCIFHPVKWVSEQGKFGCEDGYYFMGGADMDLQ